jgi:hypothetical protein
MQGDFVRAGRQTADPVLAEIVREGGHPWAGRHTIGGSTSHAHGDIGDGTSRGIDRAPRDHRAGGQSQVERLPRPGRRAKWGVARLRHGHHEVVITGQRDGEAAVLCRDRATQRPAITAHVHTGAGQRCVGALRPHDPLEHERVLRAQGRDSRRCEYGAHDEHDSGNWPEHHRRTPFTDARVWHDRDVRSSESSTRTYRATSVFTVSMNPRASALVHGSVAQAPMSSMSYASPAARVAKTI